MCNFIRDCFTRDLSKCYGAPMVQSLPYFMDAPNFLRRDVEFLDFNGEDRDKHGIFDIVEQKTGSSLSVHKRMQGRKMDFRRIFSQIGVQLTIFN